MAVNIAIDGTAGSGKGTIAKGLSQALGYYHLDSGAMYRTITYKCLEENVDVADKYSVCEIVKNLKYDILFKKDKSSNPIQINLLDGEDLGQKIRSERISKNVSLLSQHECVREYTKKLQLDLAKKYNIIIEGRDIGTIILPNADFKFFVTASLEERARRRVNQLELPESQLKEVMEDIRERDRRDMERDIAPLKVAEGSYYIDNNGLTVKETIDKMLNIINNK